MDTDNLIRLGVFSANRYGIDDNFKIIRVTGNHGAYRILVTPEIGGITVSNAYSSPTAIDYEEVILDKLAFRDNSEFVRVGYSRKTKTLVIQEIEQNF